MKPTVCFTRSNAHGQPVAAHKRHVDPIAYAWARCHAQAPTLPNELRADFKSVSPNRGGKGGGRGENW